MLLDSRFNPSLKILKLGGLFTLSGDHQGLEGKLIVMANIGLFVLHVLLLTFSVSSLRSQQNLSTNRICQRWSFFGLGLSCKDLVKQH